MDQEVNHSNGSHVAVGASINVQAEEGNNVKDEEREKREDEPRINGHKTPPEPLTTKPDDPGPKPPPSSMSNGSSNGTTICSNGHCGNGHASRAGEGEEEEEEKDKEAEDENGMKKMISFAKIPGEKIRFTGSTIENGFLALTNYRLIIGQSSSSATTTTTIKTNHGVNGTGTAKLNGKVSASVNKISLPLGTIDTIELKHGDNCTMYISTKHVKCYKCTFKSMDNCYQWYKWLNDSLNNQSKYENLFCFMFYEAGCKLLENSSVYYSLIQALKKSSSSASKSTTNGCVMSNGCSVDAHGHGVTDNGTNSVGDEVDGPSSKYCDEDADNLRDEVADCLNDIINGVASDGDDNNVTTFKISGDEDNPLINGSVNGSASGSKEECAINPIMTSSITSSTSLSSCPSSPRVSVTSMSNGSHSVAINGQSNCSNGHCTINNGHDSYINGLSMSASNLSLYQLPFTNNDHHQSCQQNQQQQQQQQLVNCTSNLMNMTSSMTSSTTSISSTISNGGHCNGMEPIITSPSSGSSSSTLSHPLSPSASTSLAPASKDIVKNAAAQNMINCANNHNNLNKNNLHKVHSKNYMNMNNMNIQLLLSTDYSRERIQFDFDRLEFNSVPGSWKITTINTNYKLCPSYPEYLIVPFKVKDEELVQVATFRSNKRIPTVVWRYKKNGCTISRSSQPEVGWLGWRSSFDESMISSIVSSCFNPVQFSSKKLLILDARSYAAAVANRAKGGGCECPEYYPSAEVSFMGLANIHSIRKSFQSIRYLCQYPVCDVNSWNLQLDNSRWLHHIAGLIKTALIVVNAVDVEERPVLVHCSDGWDRTPQIVSLAELLLDPFYRTMFGFEILIQREWIDFGHKFADRCNNGSSIDDPNERCPVFLQWLDCVHQIVKQFPSCFEFNLYFLEKLILHVHSCLFGTFTCNTPEERIKNSINRKTFSLWLYLNNSKEQYLNKFYVPTDKPLRPSTAIKDMIFWSEIYGPSMTTINATINGSSTNGSVPNGQVSSNGHGALSGNVSNGSTSSASADLDSVASPFSYIFKLLRMDRSTSTSAVIGTSVDTSSDHYQDKDDQFKESMEMSTPNISNTSDTDSFASSDNDGHDYRRGDNSSVKCGVNDGVVTFIANGGDNLRLDADGRQEEQTSQEVSSLIV